MTTAVAWMAPVCALIGICMAAYLGSWVLKQDPGPDKMNSISIKIQQGAKAFLMSEYKLLVIFMVVVGIIMAVALSPITALAFATGGVMSAAAGYAGMHVATRANTRTAHAAEQSVAKALNVSFKSGLTMGLCVASFALLGLSLWLLLLVFGIDIVEVAQMHENIGMVEGFATGASAVALFARVGGGIYTKAADVGADLVGKVEAGIPEDDPRNPATIADNVGDNVGDVAGMGADLYESYVGSIVSTIALAVAAGYGMQGVGVPMVLAALGVLCSVVGTFFVKTKEGASQRNLLRALRTGTYISAALFVVCAFVAIRLLLPQNMGVFVAVLSGLVAGVAIGAITEYYTSDTYKPTQRLAASSETGSATVIISGLSLGMLSTVAPVVIVGVSVLVSYFFAGGAESFSMGLYGVGVSAVGMLSTLGITLATDAYGPVADNAGGIAEMTHMPAEVRQRTDALDSLGNTTAATGKGFAIGSAALTALALIVSYIDKVQTLDPNFALDLSITNPTTLIGLFIGGMLPFLFAALTMDAVGKAAQSIVVEVRRQFREITGLLEGKAEPDYAKCVDMCTRSAQKLMVAPALIAVIVPVVVGLILGVNGVAGLLAGNTVTGFVLAVMMSNAGGAWDNAKKYIESGAHGGKGSKQHKAAVVGDTVGDPFKDTSGPAINILIKLTSTVSIVFAGLIVAVHLL